MRRLNTSRTRRLVLEYAHRRRTRGREWFSFSDLYRACRLILGHSGKPNVNRHVLAFVEAGVMERKGHKNAKLRLTEDGQAVYADWGGMRRIQAPPEEVRSLEEATLLAEGAQQLLNDLVGRLQALAVSGDQVDDS